MKKKRLGLFSDVGIYTKSVVHCLRHCGGLRSECVGLRRLVDTAVSIAGLVCWLRRRVGSSGGLF